MEDQYQFLVKRKENEGVLFELVMIKSSRSSFILANSQMVPKQW